MSHDERRQPDDHDEQWRRPAEPEEPAGPTTPTTPVYTGPPPTTPPPPGWQPRLLIQPPPPRRLPAQDVEAIRAEAAQARTITYGVGMVAGAILLVVLFILCARAI